MVKCNLELTVDEMFEVGSTFSMDDVFSRITRDFGFEETRSGFRRPAKDNHFLDYDQREYQINMLFGDYQDPSEMVLFNYHGGEVVVTHIAKDSQEQFMKYRMSRVDNPLLMRISRNVRKKKYVLQDGDYAVFMTRLALHEVYPALKAMIEHADIMRGYPHAA